MQLRWNDEWLETPAPAAVPGSVLVRVAASAPLGKVRTPTGRVIRDPYRKALRFLTRDGPASTLRKVRSKRADQRLQGDYRVVAIAGERADGGEPVLALCARAAPCAQLMLAHEDLVVPAADPAAALGGFAGSLGAAQERLLDLCTQSFLYSGERPPAELAELVRDAAAGGAGAPAATIAPPAGEAGTATALRLDAGAGAGKMPVAVLGGGDYARTEIIPALSAAGLTPFAISDREPQIAAAVGRASGFALATTDAEEAIDSLPEAGLVVVATAHDSHAALGARALDAGHRVFVEKPPVVAPSDLDLLAAAAERRRGALEVGFNRRHHRLSGRLREALAGEPGPLTITCIVREITLTPNHWYFWPNQGTRVAGNLCHWLDLGISFLDHGVLPVEVTVTPPARTPGSSADAERVVTVGFDDGSVLSVIATDRGDDLRGVQEVIDVRRGLTSARIDDFKTLTLLRNGRARTTRSLFRTKGHSRMFERCFKRVAAGAPAYYPADDLRRVALVQLAASALIAEGGTMAPEAALSGPREAPARSA